MGKRIYSAVDFVVPGKSWQDRVVWLADHGFTGIELTYRNVTDPPEKVVAFCERYGISIVDVTGVWMAPGVAQDSRIRSEHWKVHHDNIRLAAQLGCDKYIFVDHIPPDGEEATNQTRARLVDDLKRLGDTGAEHGVVTIIEALATKYRPVMATVADAAAVVAEVAHPNVQLMLDSYHMAYNGEDLAHEAERWLNLTQHVHCSDYDPTATDERYERPLPGFGRVDFEAFLRPILEGGYDGPIGFEGSTLGDPASLTKSLQLIRTIVEKIESRDVRAG